MCRAIDVANFFIDLANSDPDDCMTNLRVNKLLYFARHGALCEGASRCFRTNCRRGNSVPSCLPFIRRLSLAGGSGFLL